MTQLRAARPEDLRACADVLHEATRDLARRRGATPPSGHAEDALPLLLHAYKLAPQGWHVAAADGDIEGFAGAWPRDGVWWLGFLHVRPARQGAGLGGSLLERALAPGADARNVATVSSGDEAALALHLREGLMPRETLLSFRVDAPASEARGGMGLAPLASSTMAFERARFGFARGHDHRYFAERGAGFALNRADGTRAGFGYVGADGRIGPAGFDAPADVAPALDALLAATAERGVPAARLLVPASNEAAARWCVGRGGTLLGVSHLMSRAPLAMLDLAVLGNAALA